jgi:hypothetical protein
MASDRMSGVLVDPSFSSTAAKLSIPSFMAGGVCLFGALP